MVTSLLCTGNYKVWRQFRGIRYALSNSFSLPGQNGSYCCMIQSQGGSTVCFSLLSHQLGTNNTYTVRRS